MSVTIMTHRGLSLRKSLSYVGASRGSYYYRAKRTRSDRGKMRDPSMLPAVKEVALRKPVYGSRMLAAVLSREMGRPVNRKLVQHAFRILGWTMPQMTKKQLIGATHVKPKPTGINQDWETDFTYVWCGIDKWCYLFSVLDIFSREWIAYAFSTNAGKDNAILAVVKAVERHPEAPGKVRLWSDNGSQYISHAFDESVDALKLDHKYIAYHKPEDDPYIESFHGKLKREYIWTRDFQTFQEAEQAIAEAFIDYNQNRPHSSLGYKTPYEFLTNIVKNRGGQTP
jgi:putative transposase